MRQKMAGLVVYALGALVFSAGAMAAEGEAHWTYGGKTGPDKWGEMKSDFAPCKLGKEQSPIDVKGAIREKLEPIKFDYKSTPLKMIDNGHTIQVNYAPGSSIMAGGSRYELLQFHFHKPSEEKVNGKGFAMVAHLVHKNQEGKLAVVGVLIDDGRENPVLKTLWSNLPKQKGKELSIEKVSIDVEKLLPADRSYYTFAGSLTTPPCSEGVTWFVLKSPVQASRQQVAAFAKLYPMNARPVQPLNARKIRESN